MSWDGFVMSHPSYYDERLTRGGYVVMAWLWGIVANLLMHPSRFFDIALRDFGLSLGAMALAQLATQFDKRTD